MFTLDEGIKGEENIADACEEQANMCELDDPYERNVAYENGKCAKQHKQIAEWLKELKKLKEQEPCEDAISRVETVQFLAEHSNDFEDAKVRMAFKSASSLVNNPSNLPTVRPMRGKGKWITKYHGFTQEPTTVCSECGFDRDFNIRTRGFGKIKFCPSCGVT